MKDNTQLKREIQEHIGRFKSASDIFSLFKLLNYPDKILFDVSSRRKKDAFDFKKEDASRINEIYSILSFDEKLPVFLLETKTLTPSFIRSVTTTFDKQYLHFLLIFSTDYSEVIFIFPNREKIETGKHKLKLTKLIINKEEIIDKNEHYTVVETLSNIYFENEGSWRDVWRKWTKAFSVERVTEAFFEDYKNIFFALRKDMISQKIPRKESHEFTLQFLNRLMFIYFISKKKWLEYPKFVEWLWNSYKKTGKYGSDKFYDNWLRQVLFKAFNNRSNEITGLPEDVKKAISGSPYLNGGLFRENGLDSLKIQITDKMFQTIFEFFEKYNFTIKEDMPLESEVAVDPQMIGYVYESLANVAEQIYDRNDLGIFYTPRIEVDFICRRSIVEFLSKQLPDVEKDKLYHLVFDLPEDKEKTEKWFDKKELWNRLEGVLDNLSVVDPACGSGAFLVGTMNILSELYRMAYKRTNTHLTDFQMKYRIIQRSLYGVDIMPWAIHAAELRLWLQLIVETEFGKEELRKHPLLPNLNLNLRIGDSLVQEIGGICFNIRTNKGLKLHLRQKLDELKDEKRKYFENSPTAKFKTVDEARNEEIRLFEEIIEERIECLKGDIETLERGIKRSGKQKGLFGEVDIETEREKTSMKEEEIEQYKLDIDNLVKVKELLKDPEKKPFVWDIDFAEIFGDKSGFDIVIGNPPYVRQEMISPPNKLKSEVTLEDRREYKEKLFRSVQNQFPVVKSIDKKSDYYIYFYFHGLSLLNEKGTFCFITSNSWLDVGYGRNLQEFLCKYVPITAIYDNPKRSFAHADVNTIIALFGAPDVKQTGLGEWSKDFNGGTHVTWPGIKHTARFVMFKKAFEEVLSAQNFIEIENANAEKKGDVITELVKNVVKTNDYRVFPILQEDLLEDGWEYPEDYKNGKFKKGSYEGNKWGGKFLRAPDIFYTILEKGQNKLTRLGNIATINEGRPTGANDFFFPTFEVARKYKIENDNLLPGIMKTRGMSYFVIDKNKVDRHFLQINSTKEDIRNKNVQKYIDYGVKEILPKSNTLKSKPIWWKFSPREPADLLCPCGYGETVFCAINEARAISSNSYTEIRLKDKEYRTPLFYFFNSVIGWIFLEIVGRKSLGGGMIKVDPIEYRQIFVIRKEFLKQRTLPKNRKIDSIFVELGIDPSKPIREQEPKPLPDRAELDTIVFDELGLTEAERKEIYWSVCEMVKQRLDKARSLKSD